MKPSYLDDQNFVQNFKQQWEMWRRSAHLYPSRAMWWSRLVNRRIRLLLGRAGVERCREREAMENFYYSALYNVLQEGTNSGDKAISLKRLQASIV
jgi:hypothetical protein